MKEFFLVRKWVFCGKLSRMRLFGVCDLLNCFEKRYCCDGRVVIFKCQDRIIEEILKNIINNCYANTKFMNT